MNRPVSSVIGLAALALLVGVAAMGCARHDGGAVNGPAGPTPAAQAARIDAVRTDGAATPAQRPAPPSVDATYVPAVATTSGGSTIVPGATADPLDASLSSLNQLLNAVDSSLSGSDAGTFGGE